MLGLGLALSLGNLVLKAPDGGGGGPPAGALTDESNIQLTDESGVEIVDA